MSVPLVTAEQLAEAARTLRARWHPVMARAYANDLENEAISVRLGEKSPDAGLAAVAHHILRDPPPPAVATW